jgi:hypothetical protein
MRRTSKLKFARELKDHQIQWAASSGKSGFLESKPEWVLRIEKKQENLFDPNWLRLIDRHEHRWFRALNSSQAFAVNLFGPLASDRALARTVFDRLVPHCSIELNDEVQVDFEYTPHDGPTWLGEKSSRQPTQVDVAFEVRRNSAPIGFLLIEVKLSEAFGTCRGFKDQKKTHRDSSPCLDARSVLANPEANCWMVSEEKRRYWEIMKSTEPTLTFESPAPQAACPFRHGLYQLMRNKVLAEALLKQGGAKWAYFGVCAHPRNDSGSTEVIQKFRVLFGNGGLLSIDPSMLISTVTTSDRRLDPWADYMRERYSV